MDRALPTLRPTPPQGSSGQAMAAPEAPESLRVKAAGGLARASIHGHVATETQPPAAQGLLRPPPPEKLRLRPRRSHQALCPPLSAGLGQPLGWADPARGPLSPQGQPLPRPVAGHRGQPCWAPSTCTAPPPGQAALSAQTEPPCTQPHAGRRRSRREPGGEQLRRPPLALGLAAGLAGSLWPRPPRPLPIPPLRCFRKS